MCMLRVSHPVPAMYDDMSLRCLLYLLHYNVVSLCRDFVVTELVAL